MSRIINTAADCNVKQYKACAYEQRLGVLLLDGEATEQELRDAFELIHSQYVDLSGLFISREFELSAYIHSLGVRIGTVTRFVELQHRYIEAFDRPFTPAFSLVKKYGHVLFWNHDSPELDIFLSKLNKIVSKEKKYEIELKAKQNELFELQHKRIKKEFSLLESRKQFITMLNRLQQAKFVINQNETSMEEIALMIADQKEQQDSEQAQRSFKKR